MIDAFGREITYARISLTDKCNLRCKYCMPEEGVPKKSHKELLSFEEMEKVLDALISMGIKKVRLTGGEPLVRKGAINFIKAAAQKQGIEVYLTTNGTLLKEYAKELFSAGVKGINISLDTLEEEKFIFLTRRNEFRAVLEGIEEVSRLNFPTVKLNAVLMKGINDTKIEEFVAFADKYGMKMRFIELMPFSSQESFAENSFVSAKEIIESHPEWKYIGSKNHSVAEYYQMPNGMEVGFIRPMSDKFCSTCNRVRITADGMLLNCLHHKTGCDLRAHIDKDLEEFIYACISRKPLCHTLESGATQTLDMNEIGG